MKVKNISARLHHIGDVSVAPGEEKEIPDVYKGSFNVVDLVEVVVDKVKTNVKPKIEKEVK